MTPSGAIWAVASDGSGWVVVNQATSVNSDIVAARISSAGVLLDPGPRSLVPATYYSRGDFQLAYAGGVFLLAYEEIGDRLRPHQRDPLRCVPRISSTRRPFALAPSPLGRMISNGSGFYAVWNEQLPDFTMAVLGRASARTDRSSTATG